MNLIYYQRVKNKEEVKINDKIINNDCMLTDKTQFLNRLQNSSITVKSNTFGQVIKNPYLAQYKIFEERLKNPKNKAMSMIFRKRLNQQKIEKQNLEKEVRQFEEDQCLREARKMMNKQDSKLAIFSNGTIEYDTNENSKQSQVLMKFRQKLQELKVNKSYNNSADRNRLLSVNLSHFTKYSRTQIGSSVRSQRQNLNHLKPHTAQAFTQQKDRRRFRSHQTSNNNLTQNKLKLPITFVAYKCNKSFAQKFTKNRK